MVDTLIQTLGELKPASPGGSPLVNSATIKIEGLPYSCREIVVYKMCSPYGAISQVNLDNNSANGCTAFVQFRYAAQIQVFRPALSHTRHKEPIKLP